MIQLFQDDAVSTIREAQTAFSPRGLWVHTHCTNVDKTVVYSFLPRCDDEYNTFAAGMP